MSEELSLENIPPATDDETPQWPSAARYLAGAFLVLGIGVSLIFLVPVISTVASGFIFAFLLFLPAQALVQHTKIGYPLAVVLIYLLLVVVVVLVGYGLYSVVDSNVAELSAGLEAAAEEVEAHQDQIDQVIAKLGNDAGSWLVQTLESVFGGVFGLLGVLAGGLFFSFLLLLAMGQAQGMLKDWVRLRHRREVTLLLTKLDGIWTGYMASQVVYGIALGALSFVEYLLLGVPYPLLMAVITGLVSLIPTVGGLLASAIVAVPCLLLGSSVMTDMPPTTFALLVLGINIVITQVTYNFLALPIVGKYVNLPTAFVLVGVLIGLALGSIVLAFLAVPILSTIFMVFRYVLAKVSSREPFPGEKVPDPPKPGFFSQLLVVSPTETSEEK